MALQLIKSDTQPDQAHLAISYSKLNTYLMCPMKFAHYYVWGTPPEHTPMPLVFGLAMHKAAEAYYIALKDNGEIFPVDAVISAFDEAFSRRVENAVAEIKLKKGSSIESVRDQGRELLKIFHAEIQPQHVMAVEFPFSVSIPDLDNGGNLPVRLEGVLDLIERDEEGSYLIGELKTAAQRYTSHKLATDLQPTVYSYAMSKMNIATEGNSTLIRYNVLLKTKKPAMETYFVSRTKTDHDQLIHLINQVLRAIDNRIFYRNTTGWMCQDCQFSKACLG